MENRSIESVTERMTQRNARTALNTIPTRFTIRLISNKSTETLAHTLVFVQFTINSNSKLFPILSQCLGVSEYNTDRIPAKLGNPTP